MYKRRDWLDVHGRDGGGSDSDTSDSDASAGPSDDESEGAQAADSHDEASGSEQETSDDSEVSSAEGDGDAAVQPSRAQLPLRAGPAPARRQPVQAVPAQSDSESDLESQDEDSEEEEDDLSGEEQLPGALAQQQQRQQRQQQEEPQARSQQRQKRSLDAAHDNSEEDGGVSDVDDDENEEGESSEGGEDEEKQAAEGSSGRQYEDLHVEEVIRNWTYESPEDAVRGVALKCAACNALLLNALAFKDHVQSKRHNKALQSWMEGEDDLIVFAADIREEEETETHMERLQRLQQQAMLGGQAAGGSAGANAGKARKKIKRAGSKGTREPQKRLGKRQRAALKEQGPVKKRRQGS